MRLKKYLTEATKKYTVLGVNQDQDKCDVCGKCNLKKVVWFSELNSEGEQVGNPFATGVDCAAKLMMARSDKKPPKKMMDNIWQVAQGIEKTKEFVKKYKTKDELEKVRSFINTKYPLQGWVVTTPDGIAKGLVMWDLTGTDGLYSFTISGKFKRWAEKTPHKAAINWVRSKG